MKSVSFEAEALGATMRLNHVTGFEMTTENRGTIRQVVGADGLKLHTRRTCIFGPFLFGLGRQQNCTFSTPSRTPFAEVDMHDANHSGHTI